MLIRTVLLLCRFTVRSGRCLKAEQLRYILHHGFKICFIFLISGYIVGIIFRVGNLLIFKIFKEGVIVGSCKADSKAAGFMISCYDDQCFFRMLIIEFHCLFHRIVKGNRIRDGRRRIIGMACPVDLAAFHHHKEPFIVIQHLDALLHIVRQRPFLFGPVQLIRHGAAVCKVLINGNNLAVLCL